jgi:hypothetical protein
MDDKTKKLKKMAIWTIAVFATIFAVVMAVLWIPLFNSGATALGAVGQAFSSAWLIFVVVAVLCIAAYLGYKLILNSKK